MRQLFNNIIRAISVLLILVPAYSFACTCADPGPDTEDKVIDALCAVDAVFIGTVTESTINPDQSTVSEIRPIQIFKGKLLNAVIANPQTTCDHWFSANTDYLIFGEIEGDSNVLSTSICGPTRFTYPLKLAEFQLHILEDNASRIGELCSEDESIKRRLRILKDNRDQNSVDLDKLLEDTRTLQSDEEILEKVRASATKIFLDQASWTLPESFRNSGLAPSDKERLVEQWANASGACLADALATYAETTDMPLSEMVADDGSFGLKGDGSTSEFQVFLETCIERAWEAVGASYDYD